MLCTGASSVTLRLTLSLFFLLTLYPHKLYAAGAPTAIGAARTRPVEDESFHMKMMVLNRTVTCNGQPLGSKYPQPMYTCQDIRVDGLRIIHGYLTEHETEQLYSSREGGYSCGVIKGQPNDVQALCQAMLSTIGVTQPVSAAYVLKPVCPRKYDEDLAKFVNIKNVQTFWETVPRGSSNSTNGHVTSLQCLTQYTS